MMWQALLSVSLLLLIHSEIAANVHGVTTVEIDHAKQPPAYDLEQIESEVTDGIARTRRNLMIGIALLEIDPLGSKPASCDSGNPVLAGMELLCEAGNAVQRAARRGQIEDSIEKSIEGHVESDPSLAPDLADMVDMLLSSNMLQVRFATELRRFVKSATDLEVVGSASTDPPGHRILTNLVRVEAVGDKIDSRIAIRLHGEGSLVRAHDGARLNEYRYAVETPKYFIEDWSQGGVGLLAASVSDALAKMAEVLGEELLLIVKSPGQRRKGYLVKPIAPKHGLALFGGSEFSGIGSEYHRTNTLQPTFKWTDFRDAYADDPLYPEVPSSELKVSYEIRIFRSRLSGNADPLLFPRPTDMPILLVPGEMLHEFRGIPGEEFAPDLTLKHCTPYAWTVRTRFIANGKTHLTHWSGDYTEKSLEELRQNRTSNSGAVRSARSMGVLMGWNLDEMWREEAQYYPLLASSPGQKCKTKDVLAAIANAGP